MRGLHGGIPLAVLAAVARSQAIDGPTGDDGGQGVDIPISSVHENHVSGWNNEDNSVHVDHDHHHHHPYPHHPYPWAAKMARDDGPTRHPPPQSVDGPTGDDEGQSLNIPISGYWSNEFNSAHDEDNSVDVDDHHHHHHDPYPYPGWFNRRGLKPDHGPDSVDGPTGDDEGQSASIPISGSWEHEVNWWNHEDNSVDVDDHGHHGHHGHHPWARRANQGDVAPVYVDHHDGAHQDHHGAEGPPPFSNGDDVASVYLGHDGSHHGNDGPEGFPPFSSGDDVAPVHINHPDGADHSPYARRAAQGGDAPDSVDGPTGDDEGQSASIPISGSWEHEESWWNHEDNSVDIDHHDHHDHHGHHGHHPWARRAAQGGDAPDSVDGPTGDDEGQSASIPISGSWEHEANWWSHEDNSVDIDNHDHHDHPHHGYHPWVKRTDPVNEEDLHSVNAQVAHDNPLVDVPESSPCNMGALHSQQAPVKTMHMVHTVTHTEYSESHATPQCQQPAVPVISPSSSAMFHGPSSMAPLEATSSLVKVFAPASSSQMYAPASSNVYGPASSSQMYAPVSSNVYAPASSKMFAPASSKAFATPSSSAVAPLRFAPSSSATPSGSASGSASPSSSFVPFTGGASHVSSAASVAAIVGGLSALLAFAL